MMENFLFLYLSLWKPSRGANFLQLFCDIDTRDALSKYIFPYPWPMSTACSVDNIVDRF